MAVLIDYINTISCNTIVSASAWLHWRCWGQRWQWWQRLERERCWEGETEGARRRMKRWGKRCGDETPKKLTYMNMYPSVWRTRNCHTICIGCEECLHDLSSVINDIDLLLSGVADVVARYIPFMVLCSMHEMRRRTERFGFEHHVRQWQRARDRNGGMEKWPSTLFLYDYPC